MRRLPLVLSFAVVLLWGCAPAGPYDSAAEYTLTDPSGVLAADSNHDFYLLADAAKRHDYDTIMELELDGKAFILKSGTRVLAGANEPTGEVCAGEVESGEYVSKHVVLACAQLK
ncbi:MAG: hypothetical protein ACYDD2_16920 [Candidatus Acidiferrales bacterium]